MSENMDKRKEVEISLDFPVQLADRKLEKLVMRRPVMGDIIDYPIKDGNDLKGELALYAHLCGMNPEEMRQIDSADYAKLQKLYLLFRSDA